jgi:vitamin B12 transporter
MFMLFRIIIFFIFSISNLYAEKLKNCQWDNKKGVPCIVISKTPNTSEYSEIGINKIVISKKKIDNLGAIDVNDILKNIPGLDIFQSGTRGQTTSLFTRGSESNHTLVMINGIAINDQSVTDGLHDFGQDFIQSIQAIEIYKGSSGAHFGPSAIAGAINFITSIDYTNSYSVNGFSGKNNSSSTNYTKITDNGWHFNFKSSATLSETGSAIAGGSEYDGTENFQLNFNSEKWINDNLKFKSTIYSRKTIADYDSSATDETGYVADNRMYTIQTGLEHISKTNEKNLTFHYHNYDRQYENSGYLDEYYSESLVVRGENKNKFSENISYGYGSEYKYDRGSFENRGSYTASTKGHMSNLGVFGNIGYKLNESSIFSIFGRSDDHKTTGVNQTYKINLTKFFDKFDFGLTHSTGLRNPTLYELYGSDNYGIGGNTGLNPEKSETNEFTVNYKIFESLSLRSTAYRTQVYDQIETNSAYSKHENKLIDINQEGLENEIFFNRNNETLSFYNIFSKSRKTNGQAQSRRPDLSYGLNYSITELSSPIGKINVNLNYKHTGKFIDWDGSANSKQKSTDILDLALTKNISGNIYSLKLTNLFNERYEKPATYYQDGRQIRIGFKRLF